MGLRVWGLGFGLRVWGLGFKTWGLGFRVLSFILNPLALRNEHPEPLKPRQNSTANQQNLQCNSHRSPFSGVALPTLLYSTPPRLTSSELSVNDPEGGGRLGSGKSRRRRFAYMPEPSPPKPQIPNPRPFNPKPKSL